VPYTLDRPQLEALSGLDFVPRMRAGELLLAGFRTDRSAVKAGLPPPLQPADEPTGLALVARYPETNFSVPYSEAACGCVHGTVGPQARSVSRCT
jgi:hypothetical protein